MCSEFSDLKGVAFLCWPLFLIRLFQSRLFFYSKLRGLYSCMAPLFNLNKKSINMKMVCISEGIMWYHRVKLFKIRLWKSWCKGPKLDDIVTVIGDEWEDGKRYLMLKEWPKDNWDADCFEPLQESTTEYEEVTFSEIKKEVPVASQN